MSDTAIICDIDGTLAIKGDRGIFDYAKCELDALNAPVALVIDAMVETYGLDIVLCSGREDSCREETIRWLDKNSIKYTALHMRRTKDNRKDAIVKKEIYEEAIKPNYDIMLVLDDRNQVVEMWRSLGLTCFQVAEGNF